MIKTEVSVKDYVRAATIIVLFLGLVLGFLGCSAKGAPAPLAKTERQRGKMPAPPLFCTMWWGDYPYRTEFQPGGIYRAVSLSETCVWIGSWKIVKKDNNGCVMVIRERMENSKGEWLTFSIPLHPCLRRGKDYWEGRFRLEDN